MIKLRLMPTLFLACMLFGACSDSESVKVEEPVTVTFNVSTLNVETQPMSRAAANSGANLEEVVSTIGYSIFNSKSELYKSKEVSFKPGIEPAPDGFGEFREVMQPDTYKLFFYAYGKGKGTATWKTDNMYSGNLSISFNDKEIFYCSKSVEIFAGTNIVEIPLARHSALLVIDILDKVSDIVSKVEYKFTEYQKYSIYYDKSESGKTITHEATILDNGMLDRFEYYLAFPEDMKVLTIDVYDQSNQVIGTKTLRVPLEANKRTIVSGNLFSSLGEKEFTILLDDIWGEDIEYPFY